ncbi:MAG: four helix bundle protein [Candidatus Uhrbacteria bacterium]
MGTKIDNAFTDCLELALLAGYTSKENKKIVVDKLSVKFDLLKFFIKLLWEIKAIDNNKMTMLSGKLSEIGKMIGGWLKDVQKRNSPVFERE